ncbi:MAG: hypothetical protein KQJ78_10685 [Deltaproteobacteria bacterium]|nr:hypothetical protein [Deltaproteobacteria bacterium]
MRVLVCLKQVREPESLFELKDGRVVWPPPDRFRMGSPDDFALEEALRLKDAGLTTELAVVTVGPPGAEAILRRALGMGADRAMHLLAPEGARAAVVAGAIAAWARDEEFDLILAGVMSEDARQGLVGPFLAERLGLATVTGVSQLSLPEDGLLLVERSLEGGRRQALELPLPALVTIASSAHTPRYPSLSNLLKAKKADLPTEAAGEPEEPADGPELVGAAWPARRRAGLCLEGDARQKAEHLLALLRERALL